MQCRVASCLLHCNNVAPRSPYASRQGVSAALHSEKHKELLRAENGPSAGLVGTGAAPPRAPTKGAYLHIGINRQYPNNNMSCPQKPRLLPGAKNSSLLHIYAEPWAP